MGYIARDCKLVMDMTELETLDSNCLCGLGLWSQTTIRDSSLVSDSLLYLDSAAGLLTVHRLLG